MRKCAGVLLLADKRVLLLRRADNGLWGFPGGHIDDGETTAQAIERECVEEMGAYPPGDNLWSVRQILGDVDYTTVCRKLPGEFSPILNEEHTEAGWFDVTSLPSDAMPNVPQVVARLAMDEYGVAKAISEGQFTSPQLFCNMYLFAMRVTGTGVAFRTKNGEYSVRDQKAFLSDDFLVRCNGLPVLWEHTDDKCLNPEEFAGRIVGTLFCPYVKGDEVWAIARIYNADVAKMMATEQWSTSPGVLSDKSAVSISLPDNESVIVEGKPFLLDHLAIVDQGVWDKGGPPVGVDATLGADMADKNDVPNEEREGEMTEERNDAVCHKDADAGSEMELMKGELSEIKTLLKAMLESQAAPKADADCGPENIPGEPLPLADKKDAEVPKYEPEAPRGRLDASTEDRLAESRGEEKHLLDKKDAQTADDRLRESRGMEDEEKKRLEREIAELRDRMPRDITDEERNELSEAESRADAVSIAFGKSAPRPMINEKPMNYRRRVAKGFQKHSKSFKDVDLSALDPKSFDAIEAQIYKDAAAASRSTDDLKAGELVMVRAKGFNGSNRNEWRGSPRGFLAPFSQTPQRARAGANAMAKG